MGIQSIWTAEKPYHHLQCDTVPFACRWNAFYVVKEKSNHTLSFSSVLLCLNYKNHTKYFTQLFPFSSWVGCHCDDWFRSIVRCCWGVFKNRSRPVHFAQMILFGIIESSRILYMPWKEQVMTFTLTACFHWRMKAVLTGWACCVMTGTHKNIWACLTAWWGLGQVSQTVLPGERDGPESGGKREQGSEREHEESCLLQLHRWCSRWDGKDGWIRSQSKTGKERNDTRSRVWQFT